jgi:hypothetical protein
MGQKRRFTRVDFHITATVEVDGQSITGTVENLSMRGLFLATDQRLPVGSDVGITIALSDQPEVGETIEMEGSVARLTDDGIAFSFGRIDFDSYLHLKNIVTLNTGDASTVEHEMDDFLGNDLVSQG